MQIRQTSLPGIMEIIPEIYKDVRGAFFENYNEKKMQEAGIPGHFPLEFQSTSKKGVIRGMHFQKRPFAQCKLVRVIKGRVLDVVVDMRKKSPTYGKWTSFMLDSEKNNMIWIPEGFAHGFLSLEEGSIMHYKLTNIYSKDHESGLMWDDPEIKIDWQLDKFGIKNVIISEKDKKYKPFKEMEEIF